MAAGVRPSSRIAVLARVAPCSVASLISTGARSPRPFKEAPEDERRLLNFTESKISGVGEAPSIRREVRLQPGKPSASTSRRPVRRRQAAVAKTADPSQRPEILKPTPIGHFVEFSLRAVLLYPHSQTELVRSGSGPPESAPETADGFEPGRGHGFTGHSNEPEASHVAGNVVRHGIALCRSPAAQTH